MTSDQKGGGVSFIGLGEEIKSPSRRGESPNGT